MSGNTRRIYTGEGHYHYVTFTCYGRRKLLNDARAKQIIIHVLSKVLNEYEVMLIGFVIMLDHAHLILGYGDDKNHSLVMQEIKRRSSRLIKRYLIEQQYRYMQELKIKKGEEEITRIWQPKYYDFNLYSPDKLIEKLNYMHQNPVRAGLVKYASKYQWSSAMFYEHRKSVGIEIKPVI